MFAEFTLLPMLESGYDPFSYFSSGSYRFIADDAGYGVQFRARDQIGGMTPGETL